MSIFSFQPEQKTDFANEAKGFSHEEFFDWITKNNVAKKTVQSNEGWAVADESG